MISKKFLFPENMTFDQVVNELHIALIGREGIGILQGLGPYNRGSDHKGPWQLDNSEDIWVFFDFNTQYDDPKGPRNTIELINKSESEEQDQVVAALADLFCAKYPAREETRIKEAA